MAGYLGPSPVPQATQTRETFTATASQTSFATGGYQAGYIDVFLNGVKLVDGTDFTATNGSDVVLTTGAASGDTLEVVAYSTYEVNSQNYTGGLTVDNDGATVLTVDRATSDGTVIDVQKDGSTVGSIGVQNGDNLRIGGSVADHAGLQFGTNIIYPESGPASNITDGIVDIGNGSGRFKDLYLSGGVYLGGTGSANKLDDYEEGTWTPNVNSGGWTIDTIEHASYTKLGNLVQVQCFIGLTGTGSGDALQVSGLPFASITNGYPVGSVDFGRGGVKGTFIRAASNSTVVEFIYPSENVSVDRVLLKGNQIGDAYIIFTLTYRTS